jgi:hypothetical protein
MEIPLPPVLHPDVIDPAVVIQVQVVDPVLFCVELPFKIPQRVRLLEQVKCAFQAEEVSFVSRSLGSVLRMGG